MFTTLVIATIPAFWPNAVLGNALNNTAVVEPIASARIAPEVSSPLASLLNPAIVIPLVFPIVSSPETIYIVAKLNTASAGNCNCQGIIKGIGNPNKGVDVICEKFNFPIKKAATYPTIIPIRIADIFHIPFPNFCNNIIVKNTINPNVRFPNDP